MRLFSALTFALIGVGCARAGLDPSAGTDEPGGAGGRAPARHRSAGAICPPRGVPEHLCAFARPDAGAGVPGACHSNADCREGGRSGYCASSAGMTACQCSYDLCTRDSDCQGGACVCLSILYGNSCLGGGCRVDGDCGVGGYCSPDRSLCGGGVGDYQCHTPNDTCLDDADCASPLFCGYDSSITAWRCQAQGGCIP